MHSATLAQYIHVCILVQEKIKSKFLFKIEKNSLTFCTCTYLRIVYRIDNFGTVDSITFLYWWYMYGIVYLPKKKKKKIEFGAPMVQYGKTLTKKHVHSRMY